MDCYVCKKQLIHCAYAAKDGSCETGMCICNQDGTINKVKAAILTSGSQEAKADAGKPKLSLVPTQIIRDIAEVREYGNRKYGNPQNWRQVEPQRYIDALYRHLLAVVDDPQSVDEESGIPHYKHVACNAAFLCELLKEPQPFEEVDDEHTD